MSEPKLVEDRPRASSRSLDAHRFSYDDLANRDKLDLGLFRPKGATDPDTLPHPPAWPLPGSGLAL